MHQAHSIASLLDQFWPKKRSVNFDPDLLHVAMADERERSPRPPALRHAPPPSTPGAVCLKKILCFADSLTFEAECFFDVSGRKQSCKSHSIATLLVLVIRFRDRSARFLACSRMQRVKNLK